MHALETRRMQGLGCKDSSPSGCSQLKGIAVCKSHPRFPLLPLKNLTWCMLPAASANPELCPSAAAVELPGSCGAEENNEKGSLYQRGQ